ncbi:hypothetical protein BJV77DRAFT_1045360, partial [Russula vinacea]
MFRPFPRALQALAPLATSPPRFPTPKAAPSKLCGAQRSARPLSPPSSQGKSQLIPLTQSAACGRGL